MNLDGPVSLPWLASLVPAVRIEGARRSKRPSERFEEFILGGDGVKRSTDTFTKKFGPPRFGKRRAASNSVTMGQASSLRESAITAARVKASAPDSSFGQ
jgi:hypothetical protein